MKKGIIIIGALFYGAATVSAKTIDRQTALQNVKTYMKNVSLSGTFVDEINSSRSKSAIGQSAESNQSIYIFNIEGGGFVVASGDDQLPAILGYSSEGKYDSNTAPANLTAFLNAYSEEISYIQKNNLKVTTSLTASYHNAVDQLMTSKWNQDSPYNNSCPDFFTYGKSVTGCTATAMAQVLYFHRNDTYCVTATKAEIPAYSGDTNWGDLGTVDVSAVPANSLINWSEMLDSYSSTSTSDQQTAVADLMFYCGASINTSYANAYNGGSSASLSSIPGALKKYFGYSSRTKLVERNDYGSEEAWDAVIYGEIASGRPVIMAGQSEDGGHAFVADGYDGKGYYHINWGWGGEGNGNFLLNVLTPQVSGIGAGSSDGYNNDRQAIIYATPANDSYSDTPVATATAFSLDAEGTRYSSQYMMSFNTTITYLGTGSSDFYIAIGAFDSNGNLVAQTQTFSHPTALNSSRSVSPSGTVSISISEGTYDIYPICSVDGNSWTRCESETHYVMNATSTVATYTEVKLGNVDYVSVSPSTGSVAAGSTIQFSATVSGENLTDTQESVVWSVSGNSSNSTTIDSSGKLHVGSDETSATVTVKATSSFDNLKSASVCVSITAPVDVNNDGRTSIADIAEMVRILRSGSYDAAADLDGDGKVSLTDLNIIVNTLIEQ